MRYDAGNRRNEIYNLDISECMSGIILDIYVTIHARVRIAGYNAPMTGAMVVIQNAHGGFHKRGTPIAGCRENPIKHG